MNNAQVLKLEQGFFVPDVWLRCGDVSCITLRLRCLGIDSDLWSFPRFAACSLNVLPRATLRGKKNRRKKIYQIGKEGVYYDH